MKEKYFNLFQRKISHHLNPIRILGIITFLVQIHTFYGEDIVNARDNFLHGAKIDFWGGVSTLVYANIPSFGFRWQIWLGLFQILLTTIGLNKLLSITKEELTKLLPKIAIVYSALLFSSQMTRDSLMFSLLIFGFANLKEKVFQNDNSRGFIIPFFTILFGMSFRPWLSVAIVPLIFVILSASKMKLSKIVTILLLLVVSVTPSLIEVSSTKVLGLLKSYPEQQVMLMDSAASYCYTTNSLTGERAKRALQLFSTDSNYSDTACQLFRPDTWLSLTKGGNTSSLEIDPVFGLIEGGDIQSYETLKSTWLKMILLDPVTYFQNKLIFAGKLLIGSDSRGLSFLKEKQAFSMTLALYKIPYDIAVSLHLFSLLFASLILFILPFKGYLKRKSRGIYLDGTSILLFASMMFWLGLSTVAYIGSNGRYTYAISLISLVLFISLRTGDQFKGEINA
ncbi:hypothetical protein MCEMRE212_00057 [Candidatus Nanopelagicaceae bacterium]